MNWLTIVTTLIAAIAPSIVSIVTVRYQSKNNQQNNDCQLQLNKTNNEHQLKLNQLEYYSSEKCTAVSNYLDDLTYYLKYRSDGCFTKYKISMTKACMYVSKSVYGCIRDIDVALEDNHFDDVQTYLLDELLETLNSEVPKYDKSN